jgi:hypothetical protein
MEGSKKGRKKRLSSQSGFDLGGTGRPNTVSSYSHAMTLQSATTTDAEIITMLQPSDILLGRGAPIAYYEGNVRFRELIATRKMEYMSTGRHHRKREIAEQIFEEVRKRGGRFLVEVQMVDRSIAATVAAHARSSTVESSSLVGKTWKVAEDCIALEKVKQTLREKHSLERGAVLPMGAAASDDNGMQGGNDETKAADGATGEIVKEAADETEAAHSMRDAVKLETKPQMALLQEAFSRRGRSTRQNLSLPILVRRHHRPM